MISVLMSTHPGEKASHLAQSLESIWRQTLLPAQVVLVVDGPIAVDQQEVIAGYGRIGRAPHGPRLTVVKRPKNGGLAVALNDGLECCDERIIARMDSDDISLPYRLERQIALLERHPDVSLVCGWHHEFSSIGSEPKVYGSMKCTPADHEEIARSLTWRCTISHPTVMLYKSAAVAVGGYRSSVGCLEDYDFYMRLLSCGFRFAAVQEPLVEVRTTPEQRARRSGFHHLRADWAFKRDCYLRGNLKLHEWILSTILWEAFRVTPPGLKPYLYRFTRV